MKTLLLTLGLLTASGAMLSSCNNDDKPKDAKEAAQDANDRKFDDTKKEDDAKWAANAAEGGMLEVQLGKLAQTAGASQAVKDFGKTMVEDHTKAGDELKAIAQKEGISLPVALGEKRQKDYDDLAKKQGADFDRAYTDFMVDDHQEDIDDYKKERDNGKDDMLKTYAGSHVPILEHHLEMAKAARDAVKK